MRPRRAIAHELESGEGKLSPHEVEQMMDYGRMVADEAQLSTDLGFSLDKHGDPSKGNGLSMVFPYMAPDNNFMFGDQVAPEFIVNKNRGAAKSGTWDPQ